MGLADEIADQVRHREGRCKLLASVDGMTPEDRTDLADAISGSPSASAIARALRGRGIDIGRDTIARHRRGDCRQCADRWLA